MKELKKKIGSSTDCSSHSNHVTPMNTNKFQASFPIVALDFVLLNLSFFALNYLKRDTFNLTTPYTRLLLIFYVVWFSVSFFTGKFDRSQFRDYGEAVGVFARASVFCIYFTALIVVMFGLSEYSRLHVFGAWGILFFLETAIFSMFDVLSAQKSRNSIVLIWCDFIALACAFFIINYYKRGTFRINPDYEIIMLILVGVWFISSFVTNKFNRRHTLKSYGDAMASCIKGAGLMFASMSVLIFAFRLFYFSRLQIYGSILCLLFGEILYYYIYFLITRKGEDEGDIETIEDVRNILEQREPSPDVEERGAPPGADASDASAENRLRETLREESPWLFDFIRSSVDLSRIWAEKYAVVDAREIEAIGAMDNRSVELLVNLHKLNDIRWINRYFLEARRKLFNGGYLIGKADTIVTHRRYIFRKHPKGVRYVVHVMDFLINRVIPKLLVFKKAYFMVTKGKNRRLSRAEVLGRLHFCGFKVIAEEEHDLRLHFIARKAGAVSPDKNPTYGPIVKLKRIGAKNRVIDLYKFRTMHPYSEYLQEYVYEKHNLRKGGKFRNDFRITALGKLMRKAWMDELPMAYNWIKGDVKLVGVRPLSLHYMSLYPQELWELRGKVKPGLVPPYYVDLPDTLDEICDSEKRYIESFLERPVATQWRYFWRALYNIVVKGARSK